MVDGLMDVFTIQPVTAEPRIAISVGPALYVLSNLTPECLALDVRNVSDPNLLAVAARDGA